MSSLVHPQLLSALVNFPTTVDVRIVSRPGSSDEHDTLVADMGRLCEAAGGSESASLNVTPRGSRLSIGLKLSVPSAEALAEVRAALTEHPRVQMVF